MKGCTLILNSKISNITNKNPEKIIESYFTIIVGHI
mgnify:CR=1 FL=1|jgi:hypothetical protein